MSEKKYLHENWKMRLAFVLSVLGCFGAGLSAILWNNAHINIHNLCGNQFTYPNNIASCNAWSHRDNIFSVITMCYGFPCFLGVLILGMLMVFSFMDKRL